MRKFQAFEFFREFQNLQFARDYIDDKPSEKQKNEIVSDFGRIAARCSEIGLTETAVLAGRAMGIANKIMLTEPDGVRALADNLWHDIQSRVEGRTFLYIKDEHVTFVDNERLFGDVVWTRFPSARTDIKEAGNCLAADCNTAAVFHLMRAVEWGLRALCGDVGLTKVVQKYKPSGKHVYIPIEYTTWEKVLDQLPEKVDEKVERIKSRQKKQEAQEFYYPALLEIRAIKDAWRNHVMHTRREYNESDADAIYGHVKRLMTTLAGRISERRVAAATPARAGRSRTSGP